MHEEEDGKEKWDEIKAEAKHKTHEVVKSMASNPLQIVINIAL